MDKSPIKAYLAPDFQLCQLVPDEVVTVINDKFLMKKILPLQTWSFPIFFCTLHCINALDFNLTNSTCLLGPSFREFVTGSTAPRGTNLLLAYTGCPCFFWYTTRIKICPPYNKIMAHISRKNFTKIKMASDVAHPTYQRVLYISWQQ